MLEAFHRQRHRLHQGPGDGVIPHLKFCNDNRGYVNTGITKHTMPEDFRVSDYATTASTPSAR